MENKRFYLFYKHQKKNTAGSKAPDDIRAILKRNGWTEIVMPAFPAEKGWAYKKLWLLTTGIFSWIRVMKKLPEGAVVFYQHPSYGYRIILHFINRIRKKKGCRFIALIHDLESLRGGIAGVVKNRARTNSVGDDQLLKSFDAVICHNEHMRRYMVQQGFDPEKLINLEIFDYLCNPGSKAKEKGSDPSVAIAGNLAEGKCSYIYNIYQKDENSDLKVHLYGINFQENRANQNMIYHGSFLPEELPSQLEGDFGLVWDGNSAETCAGNTGEYLKYNNPHKTSLYLASGMPVIVWNQAAIADFVLENGVGITVDSLDELKKRIDALSEEEYNTLIRNTEECGSRLRDGYYTKKALQEAVCLLQG